MACGCYLVIKDPERAEIYRGVFPSDHIPISNPLIAGRIRDPRPDHEGESFEVYMLALEDVTPYQKAEMVSRLAKRFGLSEVDVIETWNLGVPINAQGVVVSWCPTHSRSVTTFD